MTGLRGGQRAVNDHRVHVEAPGHRAKRKPLREELAGALGVDAVHSWLAQVLALGTMMRELFGSTEEPRYCTDVLLVVEDDIIEEGAMDVFGGEASLSSVVAPTGHDRTCRIQVRDFIAR